MKKLAAAVSVLTCCLFSTAQDNPGYINGNIQVLWQQYNEDSLIGAQVPAEKTGLNAFGNLLYTKGNFSAGIRYETYLPSVLGYPGRFKGTGIDSVKQFVETGSYQSDENFLLDLVQWQGLEDIL